MYGTQACRQGFLWGEGCLHQEPQTNSYDGMIGHASSKDTRVLGRSRALSPERNFEI